MRVRDIMTTDIEYIRATDSVKQAAEKMALYDIGALPVSDHGEIVGIITDRDIAVRAVADGADPMTVRTGKVMTPDLIACAEDTEVEIAAALMREHRIRRLLVQNAEGRMVGLVAMQDLAASLPPDAIVGLIGGIYEKRIPTRPAV